MGKMLVIGDRTQRFRQTLEEMHQYCKCELILVIFNFLNSIKIHALVVNEKEIIKIIYYKSLL